MLKPVQLGKNSGLRVSQLCLGTMNFGEPGIGHQGDWTLGLDAARPIFKAAIDKGLFYAPVAHKCLVAEPRQKHFFELLFTATSLHEGMHGRLTHRLVGIFHKGDEQVSCEQ